MKSNYIKFVFNSSLQKKMCSTFRCTSGQCISNKMVCNKKFGCRDGSDEDSKMCQV